MPHECNINVAMSQMKEAGMGAVVEPAASVWAQQHGARLRRLRIERGLRQQDLAERIGAARTVYSNWETGTRRPNAANLTALATALGVSVEELLRGQALPDKSPAESEQT